MEQWDGSDVGVTCGMEPRFGTQEGSDIVTVNREVKRGAGLSGRGGIQFYPRILECP